MKYRKKPVVIEAYQWPGDFMANAPKEFHHAIKRDSVGPTIEGGYNYYIETLEGEMDVTIDDFVIKGVKGEFYPCKPDIFEATYERVEE